MQPGSIRSQAERRPRERRALTMEQLAGATFGDYRAQRLISTGAFGAVLLARHPSHSQPVVIKCLPPHLRTDPASMSRLALEAHVLNRLGGAHVVRLIDTGWGDGVGPYVVLEHLSGMDLSRQLQREGPFSPVLAVDYLLQACAGLAEAHSVGIVHLDVKPENLFVVLERGQRLLKLLDFGICQCGPQTFAYRDVAAVDYSDEVLGTPAYMSPERLTPGAAVDHRSDIWSLGAVLHELLTGRAVFVGANNAEVCTRVRNHRLRLESDPRVLPQPLRAVIARCLARHPRERFQSVGELVTALLSALARCDAPPAPHGTPSAPGSIALTPAAQRAPFRRARVRQHRVALALAVLFASVALPGGAGQPTEPEPLGGADWKEPPPSKWPGVSSSAPKP